ncbi:MAG: hypothetical protein RMJ33_06985 [Saprospiraceae bacterium]|nr:hypothetical protein [Saprospiraceae bacterium]MDW8229565.1 hypothetical protein [Saprospiraceae bacterium]
MLHHWVKPLPKAFRERLHTLPDGMFGQKIRLWDAQNTDFSEVKIALLGAGEAQAQAVREALYRMAYPFAPQTVIDLGNLRRSEAASMRSVLFELISAGILPVVMAASDELARMQFLAYEETKSAVSITVVDEQLRIGDAPSLSPEQRIYTSLLHPRHRLLFHAGFIGCQTHRMSEEQVSYLMSHHFDVLRLGKSRAALEEAEPILRDADLLCFHLSALKAAEAPGVLRPSPSGYTWEEACQLCRYAGMSDKLTSFGIYGFVREDCSLTAQGVAQMIWYFLDGFFNRKGDFPFSTDGLKEYVVDFPGMNFQITFWKSARSGRWWLQTPSASAANYGRHYLVPCSFQDYQAACREELPERLVQALQRFT